MLPFSNEQILSIVDRAMSADYGLFDEQQDVMVNIVSYILTSNGGKHLLFRASAGTGKTFTIRAAIDFLSREAIWGSVVALTGRACTQLKKGIDVVRPQTIHSLFYKPRFNGAGELTGFMDKSTEEILKDAGSFIVVDEGSMVPLKIYNKIKSIGLPVVFAGDLSQLEPVDQENPHFNVMLEEIEAEAICSLEVNRRTDEESIGIVKLYEILKEDNSLPRIKGNGLKMMPRSMVNNPKFLAENQFDVILCGMNKTRKALNDTIRKIKFGSRPPETAQIGETVICLRNDMVGSTVINNGERFEVVGCIHGSPVSTYMLQSLDVDSSQITVEIHNSTWQTEAVPSTANEELKKKLKPFGFGYAISVHKAQGSTFDNVLFFDEDVGFFLDRRKFRYTAVTRAAKQLTIAL